jgi:hypothetical protein
MNVRLRLVSWLFLRSRSGAVEGFAVRFGKRAGLLHCLESCQEPRAFRNLRLELTFQTAASCTLHIELRLGGLQPRLVLRHDSLVKAARLFARGFGAGSSAVLLLAFVCRRNREFVFNVERRPHFLDLSFEVAHRFGHVVTLPSALFQFDERRVQSGLTRRSHSFRGRIGFSSSFFDQPVDNAKQFPLKCGAQAGNSVFHAFVHRHGFRDHTHSRIMCRSLN